MIKSCAPTSFAAACTSSKSTLGLFKVMLLNIVSEKRKTSWSTTPILLRIKFCSYFLIEIPSMRISPFWNSYIRFIKLIMEDFPAPVGPTNAIVSPCLTLKFRSFKIQLSVLYENHKFLNSISPFKPLPVMVPLFSILESVSNILKTRSELTIPICKVLKRSASCLIGRKSI